MKRNASETKVKLTPFMRAYEPVPIVSSQYGCQNLVSLPHQIVAPYEMNLPPGARSVPDSSRIQSSLHANVPQELARCERDKDDDGLVAPDPLPGPLQRATQVRRPSSRQVQFRSRHELLLYFRGEPGVLAAAFGGVFVGLDRVE